jgi:hypothetical protein
VKKAILILVLLAAFNLTAPNIYALNQKSRHTIEFRQEDRSRDLTNNELLKNRVVTYLRLNVLEVRVMMINRYAGFNTS